MGADGGKKGGGVKVYDMLMSIDFGICHGVLDRVNQIWIKDKPVWCGNGSGRIDISINHPDMFGGDSGEGGPVGVVEIYDGRDSQLSSEALASRLGRSVATMPGYVGLAHMFFRGGESSTKAEGFARLWAGFWDSINGINTGPSSTIPNGEYHPGPDGGLIPGTGGGADPLPDAGIGFRWLTNNPYLPAMHVSVTRLPRTLSNDYALIWPIISYDPATGDVVTAESQMTAPQIVGLGAIPPDSTLSGMGHAISDSEFDTGATTLNIDLSGTGFNHPLAGGDPGSTDLHVFVQFWDALDNPIVFTDPGGSTSTEYHAQDHSATGFVSINTTVGIPIGTRKIMMRHVVYPPPLGTYVESSNSAEVALSGRDYSAGSCTLDLTAIGTETDGGTPVETEESGLAFLPDANPAHMIHEALVNATWGKGEYPALIDQASFMAAAQTLYEEHFGLSMVWVRQSGIDSYIQEILDHIQGMLFLNPKTGLWTLRLLRDDYDTTGIPEFTPDNCVATKRKRRARGELVNEIVVSYTDPISEESATVSAFNLGDIIMQAGISSETRDYHAIRNPYLAQRVAERDVAEAGYPIFSCVLEVDRTHWDILPGDVVKFSWPEDQIESMILRVMSVDAGRKPDRKIGLHVVEDIFAVDATTYTGRQGSLWDDPDSDPAPLAAEMAMTMPLPVQVQAGGDIATIDGDFPEVRGQFLADGSPRPVDISVWAPVTTPNGGQVDREVSLIDPTRSIILANDLAEEASSPFPGSLISSVTVGLAEEGDLLMLGVSEEDSELLMLDFYDAATDTWTVARGIWDTVPRPWVAGTRLWNLAGPALRTPGTRTSGAAIDYRLLPRTTRGRLPYGDAAPVTFMPTDRPILPFRPAGCDLDGAGFGLLDYTAPGPLPGTITASWFNRNRTTEDGVYLRWGDATTTPEAGQTTVLKIADDAGVVQNEITGLQGTSYAIPIADFVGVKYGWVEFVSERDGYRSRQGARRWFDFRKTGYGLGYGLSYGAT